MNRPNGLSGQWLGTYEGSSHGRIMINIDERDSNYEGVAYLIDETPGLPITAAGFLTPIKDGEIELRVEVLLVVDPISGNLSRWEEAKKNFPEGVNFSKSVDATATWGSETLTFSWTTDIGVTGKSVLPRSNAGKPSEIPSTRLNWSNYKIHVSDLLSRRFLFRGQNGPWRLRTSFHRSGRTNLNRYVADDVPALHRQLSARTRHIFNLSIPDEFGSFLNLVQHHGYPTPLLDWSYSPYVAAFFSYRSITNQKAALATELDSVRVQVFDQAQWLKDWAKIFLLFRPFPYVSVNEFIAIENERMIPQQAVSMVTNVDDIETYVRAKETETKKYLWAIDLPVRERKQVIQDLSYMGITAGSLFPGLDGACEELKEQNFDI